MEEFISKATTSTAIGRASRRDRDLVFDIGLCNGDDSSYYLDLGYFVVGVEANPLLAAQCTVRFDNEIRQGRMMVINAGVLKESGEFTFYRNLRNDLWSSFLPEKGGKEGGWEELKVPCVTTQQLIEEHGKPFFMKVDIEGADLQTLHSITPATAPAYVSLELDCTDAILERLIELGYSAFKFVNGGNYWPTPPRLDHEIGSRLLRKMGRLAPFVRNGISRFPQRLRPNSASDQLGNYSPAGYPFGPNSSGPFGEQAAGSWLTCDAALRWFGVLKNSYRRAAKEKELWCDVHARLSSSSSIISQPLMEKSSGG